MRSPGGRPTTSGSTPCSRRSPTSAPPPARRASRCARHARTWPRALATRAITISSGHGRSGHLTVGAADYNGSARVGRNEGRRRSVAALRGTACRLPALGGSEPCQFRGGRAKRPVRGVVGAGGQAEPGPRCVCAARWRRAAGRCPAGTRRSDGSRSGPGLAVIMRSSAYSRAAAPRSPRRCRPWLRSPPGSGTRPTRAGDAAWLLCEGPRAACRLWAAQSRASSAAGAQNAQFGVSSGPAGRRNRARAACALHGGGVPQADVLRVRGVLMVPGADRAWP